MNGKTWALTAATILTSLVLTGCPEDKPTNVAPSATTLEDSKPKPMGAMDFSITKKGSKVDFMMEAPREKIRGRVHDLTWGEVNIDPNDITKTKAHLYVDLKGLELYQQVAAEKEGEYGEEKKSDLQNEHARAWLEIGSCDDADDKAKCESAKKKNENVEFVIESVSADQKDIAALKGDSRTLKAKVTGKFLLHQHKTTKTAEIEITFKMKGDKPESVSIKTTKPFAIGLAEHDVRPRTAFGKLASKTLDILVKEDKKVAKEAQVSLDFSAAIKAGGTQPAKK